MVGTGTTPRLIERYDEAIEDLLRFRPEVEGRLDALVAEEPGFALAAIARAYLGVLTSEPGPSHEALATLVALEERVPIEKLSPAERPHRLAVEAWARGRFTEAQEILDTLLASNPGDVLALFVGHQLDFFLGDSVSLRDRIGRVLPDWDPKDPAYGFLLGMFSFGLEECGWYDRAEAVGNQALTAHPEDVWALHAVVHTHEMRAQLDRGLALMDRLSPYWTEGNFLNVHNFWHQALYFLELEAYESVLEIYDHHLHHDGSAGVALEMLDAASLLWRLYLSDFDVADRFEALAVAWEQWLGDNGAGEPFYVFNDCHAVMAFVGAGQFADAERHVENLRRYAETGNSCLTNVRMTRNIGLPIAEALLAFGEEHYADVITLLTPIRKKLYKFGGSHAQRDVFQRTLLAAAIRSHDLSLARTLLNERISLNSNSRYNWKVRRQL